MLRLFIAILFIFCGLSAAATEPVVSGREALVLGHRFVIEEGDLRLDSFKFVTDDRNILAEILGDQHTQDYYLDGRWDPQGLDRDAFFYSQATYHTLDRQGRDLMRQPLVIRSRRHGGRIVGIFIITEIEGRSIFKIGYAIHPDVRGQSIGSEATRIVLAWIARNAPGATVEASVVPGNLASQNLLLKNGFGRIEKPRSEMCEFALTVESSRE